jgi:hypothetical protein
MKVNSIFVVMVYRERAQYQAALEAFENREGAEKLVQKQLMQDGVRAWIEEIPVHFGDEEAA